MSIETELAALRREVSALRRRLGDDEPRIPIRARNTTNDQRPWTADQNTQPWHRAARLGGPTAAEPGEGTRTVSGPRCGGRQEPGAGSAFTFRGSANPRSALPQSGPAGWGQVEGAEATRFLQFPHSAPSAQNLDRERRDHSRLGLPLEEVAMRALVEIDTRTIEIHEGTATTVALVGPTGVGKTTTIAKLAAVATHVERQRVAFITVDTYRIGAVEQLETYARLQEIPLTVAYSPDEVRAARDRYLEYDLVLVDTIGRSPRNLRQLEELALLLEAAQPDEVHLVLDTRASLRTQDSVMRGFRVLQPTHLLLSKLDEAAQLEDTLSTAIEGRLPLSYVTTGQRVPEDLAPADRTHLAGYLFSQG